MSLKKILEKIRWKLADPDEVCKILREKGMKIGDGCEIYKDVSFGSEPYLIKLGNQVRVTSGVKFITHDGGVWVLRNNGKLPNADIFGKIDIGDNVHIGMNAIIMPGVTIGNNVIIGCGAIVTKNIPDDSVAVGIPARVIESIDTYYQKNQPLCVFTKDLTAKKKKDFLKQKYCL